MPCTLENVLADAKSLVERLRNHDNAAEMLIEQTSSLSKRVEAMKQVTGSHAAGGHCCSLQKHTGRSTRCYRRVLRGSVFPDFSSSRHRPPGCLDASAHRRLLTHIKH